MRTEEELLARVAETPFYVAETEPGDVIAFDFWTWHTSVGGQDRRQWAVDFFKDPATSEEHEVFADWLAGEVDWLASHYDPVYDPAEYPLFDLEWRNDPARADLVARMRELGFDRLGL